jgi:hypothetical protein
MLGQRPPRRGTGYTWFMRPHVTALAVRFFVAVAGMGSMHCKRSAPSDAAGDEGFTDSAVPTVSAAPPTSSPVDQQEAMAAAIAAAMEDTPFDAGNGPCAVAALHNFQEDKAAWEYASRVLATLAATGKTGDALAK